MNDPTKPTLLWIPIGDPIAASSLASSLASLGFGLIDPNRSPARPDAAEVRVMCFAPSGDMREARQIYDGLALPTLFIARTSGQVVEILPLLSQFDDISLATDPLEVHVWRLSQLRIRSDAQRLLTRSLKIQEAAKLDPLTGLVNRPEFFRAVEESLNGLEAFSCTGLAVMDLDNFKEINDSLGHAAGDRALCEVANLLQHYQSPGDVIGRLGGDEMSLLITRYDRKSIIGDCERMLQRLQQTAFDVGEGDRKFNLTASIGLRFLQPGDSVEGAMRIADTAMYKSKGDGRNRLSVAEDGRPVSTYSELERRLKDFENRARIHSERMTGRITIMGRKLLSDAVNAARHDALTGLPNLGYLEERLAREFEIARNQGRPISVALMDIDYFHNINITFGWPTGNLVLQSFSATASKNSRLVDWVARYGGEEFLLVLPDTDLDSAREVAERIRSQFESTEVESLDRRRVAATVSIGVARIRPEMSIFADLIEDASTALRKAKELGRNRVVVHP